MTDDTQNRRVRRMDRRRQKQTESPASAPDENLSIQRSPFNCRPERMDRPREPEELLPPRPPDDEEMRAQFRKVLRTLCSNLLMTVALAALTGVLSFRAGIAKTAIPGTESVLPGDFSSWLTWCFALLTASGLSVCMIRLGMFLLPGFILYLAESLLLHGNGSYICMVGMILLLGFLSSLLLPWLLDENPWPFDRN